MLSLLLFAPCAIAQGRPLGRPARVALPPASPKAGLPDALEGRWDSKTTHFYSDGTKLRERGEIKCEWILDRTYLQCDRRYVASNGRRRHSMQLYTRDSGSGHIEVLTLYAGRSVRILQTSNQTTDLSISLAGAIPLQDGRQHATRGQMRLVSVTRVVYQNETEETPGRWRVDFEEIYSRSRPH